MIGALLVEGLLVICLGLLGFIATELIKTRVDTSLTEAIKWLEDRRDTLDMCPVKCSAKKRARCKIRRAELRREN